MTNENEGTTTGRAGKTGGATKTAVIVGFPIIREANAADYNLSESDRLKVEACQELWASIHRLALSQVLEKTTQEIRGNL